MNNCNTLPYKARPISLDSLIHIDVELKEIISKEIFNGIQSMECIKFGELNPEKRSISGEHLGVVEKDELWKAWVLTKDTKYADPDYYTPRPFRDKAIDYFPRLIQFIQSLPLLGGAGRVFIMGVGAGKNVPIHRDAQFFNNSDVPKFDRLLNFSFGEKKPLFMYDPKKNEKHYFEGFLNWIDVRYHHGVSETKNFCASVRIDAQFNPSFRKKITQHFQI